MDKYAETAFMLIALGILVGTASIDVWLSKIHRELQDWRKEWRMSLNQRDTMHNEKQNS